MWGPQHAEGDLRVDPAIFHPVPGVTPAVLVTITWVNAVGVPVVAIVPVPPKLRVPVLLKPVPARVYVFAVEGKKFKVPLLVTVPLFTNEP